jgi:hypothetical protein
MNSADFRGSESVSDYEDLSGMALDPTQLVGLIGTGGECVFTWVTRTGDPMGVVVSYLYRDGKFWTTSLTSRARIKALASRSQSTIVLNDAGRSATFKGRSVLHRHGDPDWDAVKSWFYAALVGTDQRPDDPVAEQAERSLDTPDRVIVETIANPIVSFDFNKLRPGT